MAKDIYGVQHYTLNVRSRGKQLVLFSRESWCFPGQSRGERQDSKVRTGSVFPTFCHATFHHSLIRRAVMYPERGTICSSVSRSGYIWFNSRSCDQASANGSPCLVERKSRNITNKSMALLSHTVITLPIFDMNTTKTKTGPNCPVLGFCSSCLAVVTP